MILKLISPIVFFVFFSSCGQIETNYLPKQRGILRKIDLVSGPDSTLSYISDIASEVEYISLETNEKSLIKHIDKAIICDNYIYIKNNVNSILCFEKNGKYLYKLDNQGRGPEEYTYLADFDVSTDNKTLIILTGLPSKIMQFNNTGNEFVFEKSINLKRPSPSKIDIIPLSNNILLSIDPLSGAEESLTVLMNFNGDTVNLKPNSYKYDKINKETSVHIWESLHYKYGNSVFFKEQFSDTIFSVSSESEILNPSLIFDSKGTLIPPAAKGDRSYFKNNPGKYSFVFTIIEVPRYIIYQYEYNLKKNKILYDKSTEKKYVIALKDAFIDDISGGPNFDPVFCGSNIFYSSIEALVLKNYVAGKDFSEREVQKPTKKDELKKLADALEETDNPVLVVVTPKK